MKFGKMIEDTMIRKTAIRIVKDTPGIYGMPDVCIDADFYCKCLKEPSFFYETENEFVIYIEHLLLTDACIITVTFISDERWGVKSILCEGKKLFVQKENGKVHFDFEISGLTGKTRTLYVHTILREPGVTLRLEQNDEGRRTGAYRQEPYPAVQIEAMCHYMFAMREMLRQLNIPTYLSKKKLGYILLLGFETNNEVHGDWPPHWHLIFRWPNHCGSQAPHLYLDEQGRIIHNRMCIDCIPNVTYTYEAGEWCPFVDMYGRIIFKCRIDEDGGMSVMRDEELCYSMSSYTEEGVTISKNGCMLGILSTKNDTSSGLLSVHWKTGNETGWTECVVYDPLTGEVMAHTTEC